MDAYDKVAAAPGRQGDSLFADAQGFSMCDACRYLEAGFAVECCDAIIAPEKRIGKFNRERCDEIAALPLESSIRFYMYLDVQVTGYAPCCRRLASPWHAYHFAVLNAGGHHDLDFLLLTACTRSPARTASGFRKVAAAAAFVAFARRADHAEECVTRFVQSAFAAAGRAGDGLGPRLATTPLAGFANRKLGDEHAPFRAKNRLFKRELHIDGDVASPPLAATGSCSVAGFVENVAEIYVLEPLKPLKTAPVESARTVAVRGKSVAVAVIFRAALFV